MFYVAVLHVGRASGESVLNALLKVCRCESREQMSFSVESSRVFSPSDAGSCGNRHAAVPLKQNTHKQQKRECLTEGTGVGGAYTNINNIFFKLYYEFNSVLVIFHSVTI